MKKVVNGIFTVFVLLLSGCTAAVTTVGTEATGSRALRTVIVSTSSQLKAALAAAQPGDDIVLSAGTVFTGTWKAPEINGTASNRITIESASATNKATLEGTGGGTTLSVLGDYWTIKNLKLTKAQKGLVFDNANFGEALGCEIFGTDMEGLHFRDGSKNGLVDGCFIHDTGKTTPDYGEGIYIGTDCGSWSSYKPDVFDTTIRNTIIGPNIGAECIDIKEGTRGTTIDRCTFYGVGMGNFGVTPPTIANSADSFIDIKCPDIVGDGKGIDGHGGVSNKVSITNCTFDRLYNPIVGTTGGTNSTVCAEGVQLHYKDLNASQRALLNRANYDNSVAMLTNNTFKMYPTTVAQEVTEYAINATSPESFPGYSTLAQAAGNTRTPMGQLYYGAVSSGASPTPIPTATPAPTPQATPTPSPTATPTASATPAPSVSIQPWKVGVSYKVGDIVSYQGIVYTCRIANTSIVGWEPPAVPALWVPKS